MVPDDEPFRFGPGPTIRSTKALLLPIEWGNGLGAMLRISLVACDVPPLMSRAVMRYLGAAIELKAMQVNSKSLFVVDPINYMILRKMAFMTE